jgi:hypothetical protein
MCALIRDLSIDLWPEVPCRVADRYGFSVLVDAPNASLTRESIAPGGSERLPDRPPHVIFLPFVATFMAKVAGM